MRFWIFAFVGLVLSACAAHKYLPDNFDRMAQTAVFLKNVNGSGSGTFALYGIR